MPDPHQILLSSKVIAVVGASPNPDRPSNWISKYLIAQGYTVIPVNPGQDELFGLKCYPDVESIDSEIDIVNIFRRSDQVVPIVKSALKNKSLKLVWMQDNVYNEDAAKMVREAGIPVVMNDCIYRVHRQIK
ncbi:MAG: CoA-binding protein [Candidatus Marinimicrobia bacterium]|nr:CoA-binding protein [Candidatus Neomarinimicrobiota bacterium]